MAEFTERRFDLTGVRGLERLIRSPWPRFLARAITLAGFVFTILAGLLGTPVGGRNFAIIFVWIAWWTALKLVLMPLGGRTWCSVCPIPAAAEWGQRGGILREGKGFGLNLRWPRRLRNQWLQLGGFAVMGLFSVVLLTKPTATGWILLGLLVGATGLGLVFERRAFCRYLCPIGGYIGWYQQLAPLAVRVRDFEICKDCEEKACYAVCPWGLFPAALKESYDCGLCMGCIRACPYDNMALWARRPGSELPAAAGFRDRRSVVPGSPAAAPAVVVRPAAARAAQGCPACAPGASDSERPASERTASESAVSARLISADVVVDGAASVHAISDSAASARSASALAVGASPVPTLSTKLGLRAWLRGLGRPWFGLFIMACAPVYAAVMLGPWGRLTETAYAIGTPAWMVYALAFLTVTLGVGPGLFWLVAHLGWRLDGRAGSAKQSAVQLSRALSPLGLAAWIAFTLSFAFDSFAYVWPVLSDPLGLGWNLLGTAGWAWQPYLMSALPFLQVGVLAGGLLWAAIATRRATSPRHAAPVVAYGSLFTVLMLWLLV